MMIGIVIVMEIRWVWNLRIIDICLGGFYSRGRRGQNDVAVICYVIGCLSTGGSFQSVNIS